jgi:hypothetical protein
MSVRKRMTDLERAVKTDLPESGRIQVLAPGESMEQRKAALAEKYTSTKGVIFIRIKGKNA